MALIEQIEETKKELLKLKGKKVCIISKGIDLTIEGTLLDVIGILVKMESESGRINYASLLTFQRIQVLDDDEED